MTKAHPVERDVKDRVKALLTSHGWAWFMPNARAFGKIGVSDIIALKHGRYMAVETKLKAEAASPAQERFLQDIREHGGIGFVVSFTNLEAFAAFLEFFDERVSPVANMNFTLDTFKRTV